MAKTFKGGLYIDDNKKRTEKVPIRMIDGSPIHIYPLQQHIGAPLKETVKPGDKVKVGTVIADNTDAFVSVPLHSSVSGTVKAVERRYHPSGIKVTSVVVENDGLYETDENIRPRDPQNLTSKEIISVIRRSGVVGMGGAGFPTHVKLSPPEGKKITHIIVNGAECEPYLTSDHRRMLETPEEIIDGLKIAMKALGLEQGYVGIETNKPDAIESMKKSADENITIVPLKTKYPQGAEKQLIYAITKRQVPSGGLPADVGAVVLNIDTVVQISKAFRTGMPLIERIVTMSGDCIKNPGNLQVRIGMPFSALIDACGGFTGDVKKLIMGGPMMGIAQFSADVPVIKTTSGLIALSDDGNTYDENTPCIRCGKCIEHCPMNLMPLYLNKFVRAGKLDMAEKYNVMDCIECGICSYLCPGLQSPLNSIRMAKQQIAENRRKNKD